MRSKCRCTVNLIKDTRNAARALDNKSPKGKFRMKKWNLALD
jgi:hypothetical protein